MFAAAGGVLKRLALSGLRPRHSVEATPRADSILDSFVGILRYFRPVSAASRAFTVMCSVTNTRLRSVPGPPGMLA
jgi:hypothetical protein